MSVDEKAGTESIQVINELEIRLGELAPVYKGTKPSPNFRIKESYHRLLLHLDNEWCKVPQTNPDWGVIINADELKEFSNPAKYELYLDSESEIGVKEFHLYEKSQQ